MYSTLSTSTVPKDSAVAKACGEFTKSPVIVGGILAYSAYTVITGIQSLGQLKNIKYCFQLMEISFGLGVAMLLLMFAFIPPIIVTVGLWKMYNSQGNDGGDTVRGGIHGALVLSIGTIVMIFLTLVSETGDYLPLDVVMDELFLPLAFYVYSLVAIGSLCNFAVAVQETAMSSKAQTYGVRRAGFLVAVQLVLMLLTYLKVTDTLEILGLLSMLNQGSDDFMTDLAAIARPAALLCFSIGAFSFDTAMEQAAAVDRSSNAQAKASVAKDDWVCPTCSRRNASYVSSCACGTSKNSAEKARTITKQEAGLSWICPTCGRDNVFYISTCACGTPRPEALKAPEDPKAAEEPKASGNADGSFYCTECGNKCAAGAKFCRNCGTKLT